MNKNCPLKNKNINSPCDGSMTPDGLCMNHSILFDYWGCCGGYELYDKLGRDKARERFNKWHNSLTFNKIKSIKENM